MTVTLTDAVDAITARKDAAVDADPTMLVFGLGLIRQISVGFDLDTDEVHEIAQEKAADDLAFTAMTGRLLLALYLARCEGLLWGLMLAELRGHENANQRAA